MANCFRDKTELKKLSDEMLYSFLYKKYIYLQAAAANQGKGNL